MIGFGFTADWNKKWSETVKPIPKYNNSLPKQIKIIFDIIVKTALFILLVHCCMPFLLLSQIFFWHNNITSCNNYQ